MRTILLTALGQKKLEELTYTLGGRTYRSSYCCLALCALLSPKPTEMVVLLTPQARAQHLDRLQTEAGQQGIRLEVIDIPEGKSIEEIWQVFDTVVSQFLAPPAEPGCSIVLDITNSFRHLPLLLFTAVSYLEASARCHLHGIFYGARDATSDGFTPIFDLTPLNVLVKGAFAAKTFAETGGVLPLTEFLSRLPGLEERSRKYLTEALKDYHRSLFAGLSLETGKSAEKLLRAIRPLHSGNFPLRSSQALAESLVANLERIALHGSPSRSWKQRIPLNVPELERQLHLIADKFQREELAQGLLLLREWVVNRVWLAEAFTQNWLTPKHRTTLIEDPLNRYAKRRACQGGSPTGEADLSKIWEDIGKLRNDFAHAGFRPDLVDVADRLAKARSLLAACQAHLEDDRFWRLPTAPREGERVLITPLGASPGLLFSALRHLSPDRAIVVTSEQMRSHLPEICRRADGFEASRLTVLILRDVFTGFQETSGLIDQMLPFIKKAGEVIINLTGGTTCLQWVMQAAFERCVNLGLAPRRVAFVDRRPTLEQQAEPYHQGEMIEIDVSSASLETEPRNGQE